MNMELAIESFPTEVEVSAKLIEPKERQVVKFLMKRRILMETVPFKKKNKKVNWEDLVSPRKKPMDLSIVIYKTRKKKRQNK
jgi:ATP-dependent RNA helicase RhlE